MNNNRGGWRERTLNVAWLQLGPIKIPIPQRNSTATVNIVIRGGCDINASHNVQSRSDFQQKFLISVIQ
jgi:hypothetical protein